MTAPIQLLTKEEIFYPDSDGQPMADNTKQFDYIVKIKLGIDALFKSDKSVFVAGDLLWYPVEGDNKIRQAPDVMIVFGRPKGDRGSYRQWLEDNIPPQVVFEILSPGNRKAEMLRKFRFYERYGVEEYYIYDPDDGDLAGWLHSDEGFDEIESMVGWVSPRLGIRFEIKSGALELYRPDGQKFLSYVELETQRELAQQQAETERKEKELAQARVEQLAERLRSMGINPDEVSG
ncbi:Uma2 family endonuclease [Trichocoleus sp. FACHB-90]|uniref:Uma2 family endonuclease n=1 Tax=Cyanophyceae TaxID=3028117 RepID=UPI001685A517|nr:Uma2 family endonuclease [Trichocoleus sp. FACHB-90]MBD1928933.1 Uma2 family endonuclease [Trichocoleus sp. FACHB-90]